MLRVGLSNPMNFAIILRPAVTKNLNQMCICTLRAWRSALHHRGKECPGELSTISTLIHFHLLSAWRLMITTTVLLSYLRIPNLTKNNHPRWIPNLKTNNQLSKGYKKGKQRASIANGNRRFTINNILIVRAQAIYRLQNLPLACRNSAD